MKITKLQNVKLAKVAVPLALALAFGFLFSSCVGESLLPDPNPILPVSKFFNMNETVPEYGIDYETWEGSFAVNDGRLDFNWEPGGGNDSKLRFNDTFMANCTVEMVIRITDGNGNAGILIRSDQIESGTDAANGYFIGLGYDGDNKCYVETGWMHYGWDTIWRQHFDSAHEALRLAVTMIGDEAAIEVKDLSGKSLFTGSFKHTDRGDSFAGFRATGCKGWIDDIKITNIGKGLDYAK